MARTGRKRHLISYVGQVAIGTELVPLYVNPRCNACDKVMANHLAPPYSLECPHCGALNLRGVELLHAVYAAGTSDHAAAPQLVPV